jgi:hypothetical protein
LADINRLAEYDVWEYNNQEQGYVLVSLYGSDYERLEKEGWILAIDEAETARLKVTGHSPFEEGYQRVDELYRSLETINEQYPMLSELVRYGESTCLFDGGCTTPGGDQTPGFELLALRISNESIPGTSAVEDRVVSRGNKPVFFMLANIHAREITTAEIAMRLADHLLQNYGRDANITWLVDWHEIWIIPTANPDGHWLVELGSQESYGDWPFYQRKNSNIDADMDGFADCPVWPPAISWQYGVDLNRNHDVAWGPPGSSDDPCGQTYRGPEPVSELEVAALQSLVQALIADQRGPGLSDVASPNTSGLLLTLHSYSDLVLRPWGYSAVAAPNESGLKAIGDKLALYNGYQSCQGGTCLYAANGTTDDWAYGELGIPAFTFEIGQAFMPDYGEIDATQWPENRPAFLYAARIARTPYETVLGPDIASLDATLATQKGEATITAVLDESDHGGQIVSGAAYTVDTPFWADGAEPQPMVAADGEFDSARETVTAVLDMNAYSPGRHLVFIQGQDSTGHWGVTSAAFVTDEAANLIRTFIPFFASP